MKNDELMSRRRFFKKAAKGMLPMLGAFIVAPSILTSMTSCRKGGCDGCEATCMDNCQTSCTGSCSGSCANSSSGTSCSDCSSSCSSSSTGSTCSNCANDCSSSCVETCSTTCKGSTTGITAQNLIDGHEYVDLGLSVLWATCNIGASDSNEKGDKLPFVFADDYDPNEPERWYKKLKDSNLKPNVSISGTELDTARNKWGQKWRMPTKDEVNELCIECRENKISGVGLGLSNNGEELIFPLSEADSSVEYWSGQTYSLQDNPKPESILGYCFTIEQSGFGIRVIL